MYKIPELTNMNVACSNIAFAPKMSDVPDEFHDFFYNKHCKIAAKLFFSGGRLEDHGLAPREGVDTGKAVRALGALLGSFEPKHEHKMSMAGYLIDQWFEPVKVEHENQHMKRAN